MPTPPIAGDELLEALGGVLAQHRTAFAVEAKIAASKLDQRIGGIETKLAELKSTTVGLLRANGPRTAPPPAALTLLRSITASFIATAGKHERSSVDIAADLWPGRNDVGQCARNPAEWWRMRAVTSPAMTTVSGWAADLVATSVGPIASLMPASAFSRLAARASIRLDFDNGGAISLPGRVASVLPGGGFVGENSAIPMRAMSFAGSAASPYGVKTITLLTRELARRGVANVQTIISTALREDLELSVDGVLLSNAAASALHPAGLLNGVAAIPTPTASDLVSKLALVLADLVAAISPASDAVFVTSPADEAAIAVLAPGISASFISSAAVPVGTIIAVDAGSLYFGEDASSFIIDVAEEALLHSEDTAPAAIVGDQVAPPALADVATPVRSIWQTAVIGIRLLGEVSWGTRRAGSVSFIGDWRA